MSIPGAMRTSRTDVVVSSNGFRVRWGAIFAGLILAMTVQLILTMIGGAIGLAAWDPNSGKGLGIGAGIWTLIAMLVSLYAGGVMAGYASGGFTRNSGMMHGLLVGALTTLLTTWMVASGIGAIAGTTFRFVGNAVGATASAAVQGASSAVSSSMEQNGGMGIQSEIETLLRQTGNPAIAPESLKSSAQAAGNMVTQSSASNQDVAQEIAGMFQDKAKAVTRDDIINVIVARTGKSRAEAEQLADRTIALEQVAAAKLDTFKEQAAQTAETVATATSKGIWFALIGVLLSLAAAAFGGVLGVQRTSEYVG